jgi:hypothetical protein
MIVLKPRGLNDTMRLATIGDFQTYRRMAVDGERARPWLNGGADATLVTAVGVHHAAHQGSTMGDPG